MRIAFVDHPDHERTGSSRFAREAVALVGETTVLLAGANDPHADDAVVDAFLSGRHDRWVFWQTETVAARLVPLGLRGAVLVPMLHRVYPAPDAHFLQFILSRFAVFTRALHTRLQSLGCRSAHFAYAPEPLPIVERAAEKAAWSAFFWQRQDDEVPNGPSVIAQCRALGIARLHIRRSAGDESGQALVDLGRREGVAVTVSAFTDDPATARALARHAHVVFAPRPYEGLGLTILEAMAAGQVVIAPDLPAANERIGHMTSGILYELARPLDLPHLTAERLAALGVAARARAAAAHADWLADRDRLASYILDDGRRWSAADGSAAFVNQLRRRAHERRINADCK
jgi:hypothetical protein